MNKKKIITIGIVLLIVCIVILLIVLNKIGFFMNISMEKQKYKSLNGNVYYSEKLIDQKNVNQPTVIKDYKMISNFMKKKYPNVNLIITNLTEDLHLTDKNNFVFQGYQYIDGVIIKEVPFNISTKNGVLEKEIDLVNNNSFKDLSFNKEKIIKESEAKKIVKKQILDNKKNMPKTIGNTVKTSYDFIYEDNKLCYDISIGYNSVKVDAETGEVVDKFFFSTKTSNKK